MAFAIVIIQDTHNAVYEQMRTYYQTAHNQAMVETPQKAQQLINSHYNIALLVDFEQVVNATPNTKSQSTPDTPGANINQIQLKTKVTTKTQIPMTLPWIQ